MIPRLIQSLRERPMLRKSDKAPLVVSINKGIARTGYEVYANLRNEGSQTLSCKFRSKTVPYLVTESFYIDEFDHSSKSFEFTKTDITPEGYGDEVITLPPGTTTEVKLVVDAPFLELVNLKQGGIWYEGQVDVLFSSAHIIESLSVNESKFLVSVNIDDATFKSTKIAVPASTDTIVGEAEKGTSHTISLQQITAPTATFDASDIVLTGATLRDVVLIEDGSGNTDIAHITFDNVIEDVLITITTSAAA